MVFLSLSLEEEEEEAACAQTHLLWDVWVSMNFLIRTSVV